MCWKWLQVHSLLYIKISKWKKRLLYYNLQFGNLKISGGPKIICPITLYFDKNVYTWRQNLSPLMTIRTYMTIIVQHYAMIFTYVTALTLTDDNLRPVKLAGRSENTNLCPGWAQSLYSDTVVVCPTFVEPEKMADRKTTFLLKFRVVNTCCCDFLIITTALLH